MNFDSVEKSILTSFDFDKLEKIVFNLLSNAFKYTEDKGVIEISISKYKVENGENSSEGLTSVPYIQIVVKDTGKGIAPEHLEHIFEKFFQVKDHTKIYTTGSGIGLNYIKELVEVHGGKIYVSSTLGIGTTFNVFIPITNVDSELANQIPEDYTPKVYLSNNIQPVIEQVASSEKMEKKAKHAETILVVEDDMDLMNYLHGSLSDYEVILAKNGIEGVEKAKEFQPDLIISDVMMPEMNGIELCKVLKNDLITSHIPIILLTARTLIEHKIEGIEIGADDYIEKPFSLKLLLARVKNLIDSRRQLRERFRNEFLFEPKDVTITSSDEKMIKNMMEMIENNLSESQFNVDELCKHFYLSRSHFTRKIKQLTSLSPIELLTSFRLKRAAKLVAQNKLPISEVAYMVGFEHPNSLSRAFRKEFGVSPTEYAEKYKN